MIIADTNVVSEFMRDRPHPDVMSWGAGLGDDDLAISAVTVQEIEFGIHRLPPGKRRTGLARTWVQVMEAFDGLVLAYDHVCARATGQILADAQLAGRRMPLVDAQIAGTCRAYGAALATRNVRDFAAVPGLEVIDPFGPAA